MKSKITLAILILLVLVGSWVSKPAFAYDDLLFITITSENCSTCQKLKPTLEQLEYEYSGQVAFFTLDVSSRSSIEEAEQLAEENGFGEFFNNNKGALPRVGILCPNGKIEKAFLGETRKDAYEEVLDELLLRVTELCSS